MAAGDPKHGTDAAGDSSEPADESAAGEVGAPAEPANDALEAPRRPSIGELKRCLQANHGCTVQTRQPPRPLFKGIDNEDGPTTHERPHPPRLVSPNGGFVSNLDDYPDAEEATPSIHQFFCRRLGLEPAHVNPHGPDGPVKSEMPSAQVKVRNNVRSITRADGSSKPRRR
jgi:hypothetical protein